MEEKKLYNAVQKFITLADGREIMIEDISQSFFSKPRAL